MKHFDESVPKLLSTEQVAKILGIKPHTLAVARHDPSASNIQIPYMYSCKVQEYNAIFGQQQIETISSTLNLIDTSKQERLENMKKSNIQKCMLWCQKHGVPHNSAPVNSNVFLAKGKG